jgi:hypothetical protein
MTVNRKVQKYKWDIQQLWDTFKISNLWVRDIEGEEVYAKGIWYIIDKVMENSKLKRVSPIYRMILVL